MVKHYHESKHIEHQRILARHYIIEERKEYLEQMNTVRVRMLVIFYRHDVKVVFYARFLIYRSKKKRKNKKRF